MTGKVQFIGIGAPKSGTTWIHQCLVEHPDVCMAQGKGTHYFCSPGGDYHSFFSHCKDQVVGEFSPSYLSDPNACLRIKEYNSEVKIIVCLRNPINRAISQYFHSVSLGHRNWKSVMDADEELFRPGFYYEDIKKYLDNFSNVLVLKYEDILKDPIAFMQRIYSFIGVDKEFISDSAKYRVAPTKFKMSKLGKAVHKGVGIPLGKSKVGRRIRNNNAIKKRFYKFADFYAKRLKDKKRVSQEELEFLGKMYREDIGKLEELVGKRLW